MKKTDAGLRHGRGPFVCINQTEADMNYIDLHCDTLMAFAQEGGSLLRNKRSIDIKRLRNGGCLAQFFAVWLPDKETREAMERMGTGEERPGDREESGFEPERGGLAPGLRGPLSQEEWDDAYIKLLLSGFYNAMEQAADEIAPAFCLEDLEQNEKEGKMSAFLTLEDGRAVRGSMERLESLYKKGIRLITLTWNHDNCFGRANYRDGAFGSRGSGLTAFGKEAVLRMNEMGMLVDVSHLSDEGFYDVARLSKKPFIASHSNARALACCSRNLSDEMLRLLAEKGGVAGLNFAPGFLDEDFNSTKSRVLRMAEHAAYMVKVGGEEVLALGSDLDGIGGELEIPSPESMELLWDAVRRKGFSERQAELFMRGNAKRVIGAVLG